jgi:hypothetical protein
LVARAPRRLLVADSERMRVQRRRMVREGGVAKGRGLGMAQDWVVLV